MVAGQFIRILEDAGVKNWFVNVGSDWAPIIDSYALSRTRGSPNPRIVSISHEITAGSMAIGYSMVTGEPSLVGVHTNVGTANVLGSVMNASLMRIPLIVVAGTAPFTEWETGGGRKIKSQYGQDMYDQGSIVREFVKWEMVVKTSANVQTVLSRALKVSLSPPQGPVYLMLPYEVLTSRANQTQRRRIPREPATQPVADMETIKRLTSGLRSARSPLIIVDALGREASAVPELVKLAELSASRVVEFPRHFMNFPTTHPLHSGFDPHGLLDESDFILAVDSYLPWIPSKSKPKESATIAQIDTDPLHVQHPLLGHEFDMSVTSNPKLAVQLMISRWERESSDGGEEMRGERRLKIAEENETRRRSSREAAMASGGSRPISQKWISYWLGRVKSDDSIVVSSYTLDQSLVDFEVPGSFFATPPSGYLGWEVGAALGAALGSGKEVICCVGDGAYVYGVPEAFLWASREYRLPVTVAIFNNRGYQGLKSRELYPLGEAQRTKAYFGLDFDPPLDFAAMAAAAGCHGELVEEPSDVRGALERGLRYAHDKRKAAVVDLRC